MEAFLNNEIQNQGSSRRQFLHLTMAGTAAALTTSAIAALSAPRAANAQSKLSPDAALQELVAGNKRYASGQPTAHGHDLEILREHTAEKQEPFAAVLSCADSRVPVEILFDQSIGQIFVTRVAGNVATSEIIASLEYGVAALGAKVLVVMGHASCGAVSATIQNKHVPGQISALYPHIQPAVNQAGTNLEAAIKANAQIQVKLLRQASTVIADAVKEGKLKVVPAYYDIASGGVTVLEG
jgi:carbonic anhydrase